MLISLASYYYYSPAGPVSPLYTPILVDKFERADSSTVGNDWVQNYAGAHGIATNRLRLDAADTSPEDQFKVLHLMRPDTVQVQDQGYELVIPGSSEIDLSFGVSGRLQALGTVESESDADNTYFLIGGMFFEGNTTFRTEMYVVEGGTIVETLGGGFNPITVPAGVDLLGRVKTTGSNPTQVVYEVYNNVTHEFIGSQTGSTSAGPQTAGRFSLIAWGASGKVGSVYVPAAGVHDLSQAKNVALLGDSITVGTPWAAEEETYRAKISRELGYNVTSYAVSGSEITAACPDGYTPPNADWDSPDTNNNVTKAIADGADLVVINFGSNYTTNTDGTGQVGVDNYMAALAAIVNACIAAGVDCRVFQTAPRNSTTVQEQTLVDTAAAIAAEYGDYCLEQFSTLSDGTGRWDPAYDSGDGVHPNAAGHNVYYELLSKSLCDTHVKWA